MEYKIKKQIAETKECAEIFLQEEDDHNYLMIKFPHEPDSSAYYVLEVGNNGNIKREENMPLKFGFNLDSEGRVIIT